MFSTAPAYKRPIAKTVPTFFNSLLLSQSTKSFHKISLPKSPVLSIGRFLFTTFVLLISYVLVPDIRPQPAYLPGIVHTHSHRGSPPDRFRQSRYPESQSRPVWEQILPSLPLHGIHGTLQRLFRPPPRAVPPASPEDDDNCCSPCHISR